MSATAELNLQPILVHLSGTQRGRAELLLGDEVPLEIIENRGAKIAPGKGKPAAVLRRRGSSFEIEAAEGRQLWINGEPTTHLVLASGDVIELGSGGPVVRFRLQPPGTGTYKSVQDVFGDCWACAKYDGGGWIQQTRLLIGGIPMELATRTTLFFRGTVAMTLLLLGTVTFGLMRKNAVLQEQFEADRSRMADLVARLSHDELGPIGTETVASILAQIRDSLATTTTRITALELREAAASRVIANAVRSTALLVGAYGFVEPKTGKSLRFVVDASRQIVRGPSGSPAVTLDGSGPLVESFYTGTGFIVSEDGWVVTNRHVALPWDFDEAAQDMIKQGLTPVMHRFKTFLPGISEGLTTEFVTASDSEDVAVLRVLGLKGRAPSLPLADRLPIAGEEVLVMGYPLGLRALMARSGPQIVAEIMGDKSLDAWSAADRLAERGGIVPLTSRGIVGQITDAVLVYDAETTHGGSGGPVLNLRGEVVGINKAILPEYGGSNMGVPITAARSTIFQAAKLPVDR